MMRYDEMPGLVLRGGSPVDWWKVIEFRPQSGLFIESLTTGEVRCISERAVNRTFMTVALNFPLRAGEQRLWAFQWGMLKDPPAHVVAAVEADHIRRYGPFSREMIP